METAIKINIDYLEIDRKMKKFISHFSQKLKKEREIPSPGSRASEIYRGKWIAFESMKLLR